MIRLLLADDQQLVRAGLTALLSMEPDLEVVAETSTGTDVAALVAEHSVDVALLDIEMPGVNGIDAAAEIAKAAPGCRSIIVTTFARPGYLKRALAAGVTGFVVKDTPPEQLAEAIRRVYRGLRVVDPALAEESLFTPDNPLTDREADIARLILQGHDSAHIAAALHLSNGTVRNHQSALIAKTAASNRFAAAQTARDNGWL